MIKFSRNCTHYDWPVQVHKATSKKKNGSRPDFYSFYLFYTPYLCCSNIDLHINLKFSRSDLAKCFLQGN